MKDHLFDSRTKSPYYIYCPPLKVQSAGVLVLHKFCHLLNTSGYPAYLVVDRTLFGRFGYPLFASDSSLIAPQLTLETAVQHFKERKTPIVVYPESVSGNPLGAGLSVKYLLNYLGLLGGDRQFDPSSVYFSYSAKIAATSPSPENVLFLPVSDPDFFVPPENGAAVRRGKCFYAAKYKHFHGQSVGAEVEGATEITRDLSTSQSKEELKRLFQKSEFFYCYENSALAIEAALCGCPVVFVPNKYFTELIAEVELGKNGFAWGLDPSEIARAKNDVHLFRDRYLKAIDGVSDQVQKFIEVSQLRAKKVRYPKVVKLRSTLVTFGIESAIPVSFFISLSKINHILRYQGRKALIKIAIKRSLMAVGVWKLIGPASEKANLAKVRAKINSEIDWDRQIDPYVIP